MEQYELIISQVNDLRQGMQNKNNDLKKKMDEIRRKTQELDYTCHTLELSYSKFERLYRKDNIFFLYGF